MLGGETLRDGHRLLILDLSGQTSAPLCIREPLALGTELAFGARDRILNLRHGNLGFHDRLAHLARQRAQVGRT